MKHLQTFESFINEGYKRIPGDVKISGEYEITMDSEKITTLIAGFERENDDSDSLYFMDKDPLRNTLGSLIVKNSDMFKLEKGISVSAIGNKNNKEVKIKKIGNL